MADIPSPVVPYDMLYMFMSYMQPPWLFWFALGNKRLQAHYRDHVHRIFDIESMLRFYFPVPVNFRILQSRTGLLIAGSFALQFMGCVWYGLTDLDLYVSQYAAYVVIDWLLDNGYRLVPRDKPDPSIALSFAVSILRGLAAHCAYYLRSGQIVFKFVNDAGRHIDLIVSLQNALLSVLDFHGTGVMNLVSANWAVSLVPRATFKEQLFLIMRALGSRAASIKDKYEKRGFNVVDTSSSSISFSAGERWIADGFPDRDSLLAMARGRDMDRDVRLKSPWVLPLPPVPEPLPGSFWFTRSYGLGQYRSDVRRDDTAYLRRSGWSFVQAGQKIVVESSTLQFDHLDSYCVPTRFLTFVLFRHDSHDRTTLVPRGERLEMWLRLYRLAALHEPRA